MLTVLSDLVHPATGREASLSDTDVSALRATAGPSPTTDAGSRDHVTDVAQG